MVEKDKDGKKCSITEEDTAALLQRYQATTVLALLQEVAQCTEGKKIDWNRLAAETSTGISDAKEYRMLWRHLAYRQGLADTIDNGDQPLDDESDLEYELEAFPAVSGEASTEAAACVKVLIGSGLPSDSRHQNGATVEAPLTINIPNCQSSRTDQPSCSMQGMNITVPVSVQRLPATSKAETAEEGDGNGLASNSMAPRKKRKKWSDAEDSELIAAVQKHGEGNWAHIVRADFKGERSANQLAQRWKNIKKHNQDLNVKGNSTSKLSEAQLAANHAMSLALDQPNRPTKTIGAAGTDGQSKFARTNTISNSLVSNAAESQQGLKPAKPYQIGLLDSKKRSQVTSKKTLTKLNCNHDPIRATAVAAGARIACPSDAASLLKAAQAKNAVHIMPTVGSPIPTSLPSGMPTVGSPIPTSLPSGKTTVGSPIPTSSPSSMPTVGSPTPTSLPSGKTTVGSSIPTSLPGMSLPSGKTTVGSSILTSLSGGKSKQLSTPLSTGVTSTSVTPSSTHHQPAKTLPQASQHTPTNDTLISKPVDGVSRNLDDEPPLKQEGRTAEGCIIAEPSSAPIDEVQDGSAISWNGEHEQVEEDKMDSLGQNAELKSASTQSQNPVG